MPQIVEKEIRGRICQFTDMQTQIVNIKVIKESSCLMYWDLNNIYRWAMSQKLPSDNFECEKQIKV